MSSPFSIVFKDQSSRDTNYPFSTRTLKSNKIAFSEVKLSSHLMEMVKDTETGKWQEENKVKYLNITE